jgi:hypothetical protein
MNLILNFFSRDTFDLVNPFIVYCDGSFRKLFKYQNIMVLIYHILSYLASSHSGEEMIFMAFSTRVCEHPQFELLHLLSEFYKGSSLTLSINFLILNIWLFIEANIFKAYFSQYHTPLDHQGCSLKRAYKLTSHNIILPQIIIGLFIEASI